MSDLKNPRKECPVHKQFPIAKKGLLLVNRLNSKCQRGW